MTKKSESQEFQHLVEEEMTLARGRRNLPIPESLAAMSVFLRDYRARGDLSSLLSREKAPKRSPETLEKIRNALQQGNLELAGSLLRRLRPRSDLEAAEFGLEQVRLQLFSGNFDLALEISEALLSNPALTDLSRMTVHQLRGHCLIQTQQYAMAIEELKFAETLSELFPQAASGFAALAFLVQAHSELGNVEAALQVLRTLQGRVNSLSDPEIQLDRLLTLIRAEVHLFRCLGKDDRRLAALEEARRIALWISDQVTVEKCDRELDTLRIPREAPSVSEFSGWTYLAGRSLILRSAPHKMIISLESKPVLNRVLQALARGPIAESDLFRGIWGTSYHPEKHGTHLRVTLSNLRKLLPKGALEVADGVVYLK